MLPAYTVDGVIYSEVYEENLWREFMKRTQIFR